MSKMIANMFMAYCAIASQLLQLITFQFCFKYVGISNAISQFEPMENIFWSNFDRLYPYKIVYDVQTCCSGVRMFHIIFEYRVSVCATSCRFVNIWKWFDIDRPSAPKDNVYKFKCNVIKWAFECIPQHDKVNRWGCFWLLFSKNTKKECGALIALNIWLNSNWITNRMPRIEFTDVIYLNVSSFFLSIFSYTFYHLRQQRCFIPIISLFIRLYWFHTMPCSAVIVFFLYQTAHCIVRCHFFFRDIKFHIQSTQMHQTNNSGEEKTNDSRYIEQNKRVKLTKYANTCVFGHANVQISIFFFSSCSTQKK